MFDVVLIEDCDNVINIHVFNNSRIEKLFNKFVIK